MKTQTGILFKYPLVVLLIIVILSAAFMAAIKENSRMETNLDEYMPKEHPAFVYSDQAEDDFNIKDGIIIAVENPDGIYNRATLQKIIDLTEALGEMDEIEEDDITSLSTADNILGTEDGMDVQPFYEDAPTSEQELKQLAKNVRGNEMIFGRLVSQNEKVTLIIAEIEDGVFSQEFYKKILDLGKSFEGAEKIHVAGRPIIEGTMAHLGPQDMKKMVPIVLVVIVIVLWAVLRSIRNTIFTLFVVIFSTIWAFGLMAAFSIPIYAMSTMIPVMLIAIGVADGIHLYSHLQIYVEANPGADKYEAVSDMIQEMWKPVVMTSVTTAVGFISLVTSEVYPIRYFGLFTAFGVLMAMVFSLTVIPAGIILFGMPKFKAKGKEKAKESNFSHKFAHGLVKYRFLTFATTVIILAVSISGITKIWVNSSFLEKFELDSQIVLTDTFINQHFGGTSSLNVILEGKKEGDLKRPESLKLMNQMQVEVEKLAIVGNSFGISDYVKRMHKVMNADQEAFNIIPDGGDLVAQYLLLYEVSGDPENLWKVTNEQYQSANLTFQLKSDNSKAINSALAIIKTFEGDFKAQGIEVHYAGSGYKSLIFTDLILEGQIISLIISLFLVIGLLSLMFKDFGLGLIGAVPITITAITSFGIMGLLDIPLSTTTALVSSIAIGIGIDYAVHFIERYKVNALNTGDKELTMSSTMHHSGQAISFNALVVIAGFMVLLFSVFPPNRALGALVSLNMFTSFIATVTIMFLILQKSNKFFTSKPK